MNNTKETPYVVRQESSYLGNNTWSWAVWIEADEEALAQIEYVDYQLPQQELRRVTDRETKFRLEAASEGEFKLGVNIKRQDGTVTTQSYELELEYPPTSLGGPTEPPRHYAEPVGEQQSDAGTEALSAPGAATPPQSEGATPALPVTPAVKTGPLEQEAREILSGRAADHRKMFDLAKQLKKLDQFGLARRLLARARFMQGTDWTVQERRKLAQEHALATYKDPDLPADQKFVRALSILQEGDDLKHTQDQETLGLAGAINKRLWELYTDRGHLERSLSYYLRGYQQGGGKDYGYTGINAAFVLDLLAALEDEETAAGQPDGESRLASVGVLARRQQAAEIRRNLVEQLPPLAQEQSWLNNTWWFLVTVAEAHFGLRQYQQAQEWLLKAAALPGVSQWECLSTVQQLTALARRQAKQDQATLETSLAFGVLKKFLDAKGLQKPETAVTSAFVGKVGLALSGGGFRASLFHIGVLAKLADIGVLNRIEVLSCVSGGSIIGAHYYLELRKLFREKQSDAAFEQHDYIGVVKNLERDFLAGVKKNIRTRVISSLWSNLRMFLFANYSRTMRVGELYEKHIYARVNDREGHRDRWLDELKIVPNDEDAGNFKPMRDNWRRNNKVPIMILNATSLNTGHVWQFTASYMGEPPAAINSEIDAGYRLRRMYYDQAPPAYRDKEDAPRRIRLGYAVASSSCVPGMFEPLPLPGLYKDKTVQLVDGGVFDNQGAASLLEQGCSVLLVSDASGQMTVEDEPSNSLINVVLRASSISQERIRWVQYRELEARRRSGLLQGLMFIHLKKDLDTNPVDWIDCPDPYDATTDARPPELRGPLTRYGVRKDIQQLLSAVRTDLDSFSEGEAYALMASGYFMTEYEFAKCITAFPDITAAQAQRRSSWLFLDYEKSLKQPGRDERLKQLLAVAHQSAFKIWQLSRTLRVSRGLATTLALAGLATVLLTVLKNPQRLPPDLWSRPLISLTLGSSVGPYTLRFGLVASFLLTLLVGSIFGSKVMRVANWQDTLARWATALGMGTVGALVAGIHLWFFDKWYLWWGQTHKLIEQEPKQK